MKLIREYLIKICIAIFILAILMELYIYFLLNNRSPTIWKNAYNTNIQKSVNKTIQITKKLEIYLDNLLMNYNTDLKLICKHMLLLNGKNNTNYTSSMNKDANFFNINNNKKKILIATMEELNKEDYMKNLFNESSQIYDYLNKYEEEFKGIRNNKYILKKLLSDSHKELNAISYYNPLNKEKTFTREEEINAKFLIPILKTILVKRYLRRRNKLDYIRFYIINKEEILIYPPEAYNNTYLYKFETSPFVNCQVPFPLCSYYYINSFSNKESNYVLFIREYNYYEKLIASLCLKIKYIENNPNQAFLCIEADYFYTFSAANFIYAKKFEFGMFISLFNKITPCIINKSLYDSIRKVFNESYIEKYRIDDSSTSDVFSLFHFLYYNLTVIYKENPDLNLNFTEIEEEFNTINNQLFSELANATGKENITFYFNKTICQKALLNNSYECFKDDFLIIIFPIIFNIYNLNEDYLEETQNLLSESFGVYTYSIISTNKQLNDKKIKTILNIKIERTVGLFFSLTLISIFFLLLLINSISEYSLNSINKITQELKMAEINSNVQEYLSLPEDKINSPNKEISQLKNIYETMRRSLIIKQVFNNESYLDKHSMEFYNLIQNLNKKDVKEICNSYMGFYHYKNEAYNLAENEFRLTILYINEKESKIIYGKDKEYDDKIKDAIKRSSTVSYINEYSTFEKIDENMLEIIKLKINKQRFMYLYAMTNFKLGSELNSDNSNITSNNNTAVIANKNKLKKDKDKRKNYFKEAIKYFKECKNINTLLGINQIKIIYSLIMISKSYMQLNDYKNSINNINEALNLYFEFSKSFKDNHSKNYNPKIMIFVENNIFQYILYTIERICALFNKPYASNWINLKIFETSPFLIDNIHYFSGVFVQNYLERNKLKINKTDKLINNSSFVKEYEKTKKYFGKIMTRMNIKYINSKKKNVYNEKKGGDTNHSTSNKNKNDSKTDNSLFSSTIKKEMITGRTRPSFHNKNKNLNKNITICLSEKILKKINGFELKDVIIKYFQKFFIMNENDKFSFIQFACNGKKTVYIKMEKLNYFLQKIQKINNTFELTDSYSSNSNMPFTELYNIFDSIIKSNSSQDDNLSELADNIVIIFINADDIRFTSVNECLKIVNELNKKNVSLFILSYDNEVNDEKINNIQSLLGGLVEGYFFQIKNYQQIKQIFINISTIKYQSNFFGYDFHTIDQEL